MSGSVSVRVLTYNVRCDTEEDGEHAWPNRRERVARTIRFHAPDLVGLQEPLTHQFEYLRGRLPGFAWIGRGRLSSGEGEHCPIGVRRSRFSVEETGTIWLSEFGEEGSVGWDAKLPRILTWTHVRDRKSDEPLALCNVHLDHVGERARRESAWLIVERLPEIAPDRPTVLVGDLNCTERDEPYAILTDPEGPTELLDTRYASETGHHGPTTTVTTFGEVVPGRTIDHVFVSEGISVAQHGTCADRYDEGYPSDHLPVLAELSVGE
jgi:endonuclease/exonuclease/phosphatase family metal-dependent hydrolase